MNEARSWLRLVATAQIADAQSWTEEGVAVWRTAGGANNALYQIEADNVRYACKLCVADERHRAMREYSALRLLELAGLDIAPKPLLLDESCSVVPYPAVIYRWLPGAPLQPPLSRRQLRALLDSIQRIHSLRPGDFELELKDAWFHWFDFEPYLNELCAFLPKYGAWLASADPEGPALRDRLARLVNRCVDTVMAADVDPHRDAVLLCLSRVDPNLANTVWSYDGRLRWVDWEYSGWGDPALDLADLRWHAALAELSDVQHNWMRANYLRPSDDNAFGQRLKLWDHIVVTRWPFLVLLRLWSLDHGPDRERLTRPYYRYGRLRARFVRLIERAESLISQTR